MTVFEVVGAPRLELPEEPDDIRVGLRDALLEGHNWRDGFSDEICFGLWLWNLWRPALEPGGMGREEFVDAVVADGRELWLWLLGERQWFPFITALAGRIIRRLPAQEPVPDPDPVAP
jgi:hypothetical protein